MQIEYDEAKWQRTLADRGLDFRDATQLLSGLHVIIKDDRRDYPEDRFLVYGMLKGRLVMFAYTPIGDRMRIISMRKCNDREQARFDRWLGG